MARYDGMEELLQRVRERMVDPLEASDSSKIQDDKDRDEQYADSLEALLLVLRDSQQLRSTLTISDLNGLTTDQMNDLQSILARAQRELWLCKDFLDKVTPRRRE